MTWHENDVHDVLDVVLLLLPFSFFLADLFISHFVTPPSKDDVHEKGPGGEHHAQHLVDNLEMELTGMSDLIIRGGVKSSLVLPWQ